MKQQLNQSTNITGNENSRKNKIFQYGRTFFNNEIRTILGENNDYDLNKFICFDSVIEDTIRKFWITQTNGLVKD